MRTVDRATVREVQLTQVEPYEGWSAFEKAYQNCLTDVIQGEEDGESEKADEALIRR
jgi:hypothetical protein